MLQLLDGVHLPLPAVLSGHLVLPSPPNVFAQLKLLRAETRPEQHLVEQIHGGVDDVRHQERELHLLGFDLVSTPAGAAGELSKTLETQIILRLIFRIIFFFNSVIYCDHVHLTC